MNNKVWPLHGTQVYAFPQKGLHFALCTSSCKYLTLHPGRCAKVDETHDSARSRSTRFS